MRRSTKHILERENAYTIARQVVVGVFECRMLNQCDISVKAYGAYLLTCQKLCPYATFCGFESFLTANMQKKTKKQASLELMTAERLSGVGGDQSES